MTLLLFVSATEHVAHHCFCICSRFLLYDEENNQEIDQEEGRQEENCDTSTKRHHKGNVATKVTTTNPFSSTNLPSLPALIMQINVSNKEVVSKQRSLRFLPRFLSWSYSLRGQAINDNFM